MPFEPKIVGPGEVPFEANCAPWTDDEFDARLPADLGALAVQLRDDASHLASVYPARNLEKENLVNPVSMQGPRRAAWLWVSAGTLAAVTLSLMVALPWLLRGEFSNPVAAELESGTEETLNPDFNRLVRAEPEKLDSRDAPRSSAGAMPAIFLQNVSGPELEGLFDLWEADEVEQSRISI